MAPILKKIHFSELEKKPFYLAIDEASNSNIEYLAVAATYYQNNRDILPSNKLIALLQVEESCTGEALYQKIWDLLFGDETGLKRQKNLVGIVTDGAKNMISSGQAGLTNRLKATIGDHLLITHDYCHSLNLVMKNSINCLPREVVSLVEALCVYFSKSPLRAAQLRSAIRFQKAQEGSEDKILALKQYVPTRWLSFYNALHRIIELQSALSRYFEDNDSQCKKKAALEARNMLLLKLVHRLMFPIAEAIRKFQLDFVASSIAAQELQQLWTILGEYLYKLDRSSLLKSPLLDLTELMG